jgi:cupin superfamily acireductone dioxygenase involved in methionine salvage
MLPNFTYFIRRPVDVTVVLIEVRPGDVVWFPPGLKHWHGATPTTAMTHTAIQETLNGKNVDWMEKVSDEQYRR